MLFLFHQVRFLFTVLSDEMIYVNNWSEIQIHLIKSFLKENVVEECFYLKTNLVFSPGSFGQIWEKIETLKLNDLFTYLFLL